MRNFELKVEDGLCVDTKLWRYMDLAKFVSLLHSGSLWLARSDTFKDQSEGRFPPEMKAAIVEAYSSFEKTGDSVINGAEEFQEYLCRNSYVSCWHKNADENMVMWEVYGRDSNSIALQTTVGKLKSNISNSRSGGSGFYLRSVKYSRPDDVKGVLSYSAPFFIKRPHFNFEQEVRIFLSTYSALGPRKDTPLGVKVDLNVAEAVEKVLIHPDSQDWFVEVVKSLSAKYELIAPVERGLHGNKI